ncbi:mitogen-activated protein kinase kinase 7 [Paragonimus westermani]|uniref:Mitogen-activated protein kinase kinase 7 n=1 Tax=Paragonimus westermani TaxID=34504 RepID=A0A5J4N2Z8_9TREM|nr:mitogen-activated protein kinase kinase 7 [Paragonimus westermani]
MSNGPWSVGLNSPLQGMTGVGMYVSGTDGQPRRTVIRCQRPTACKKCTLSYTSLVLTGRNRSESPITRPRSRPSDAGLSSPTEERLGSISLTITAKMDDFINEGLLGSGTCSVVYRMRHRTRFDLLMAVKCMRRSSTCQEENKRIMMDLKVVTISYDCEFIVECFGIFFTEGDVWICMEVMSTCLDKLLHDLQRPFPERVLGKITVSITIALDYLKRKHNVMHRGTLF